MYSVVLVLFFCAPHLLAEIYYGGLEYAVCHPSLGKNAHGNMAFWGVLFCFSKFPELFDTAFIVLRKTKLIFLHWYHHVTVLLFCWHSYATLNSSGLFFIVMNYSVHSVMYFYYFQTARGFRPSWAKFVTTIQISQMFIGVMINILVAYYWSQGRFCDVEGQNFMYATLMYLSYLALFVWFALKKYVFKKSHKGKKFHSKKDPPNNI